VIKKGRKTKGFGEVSAYMFGDDIAMKRGYSPVGLSVNAGNFVQINVNNIDKRTKRKSVYEKSLIISYLCCSTIAPVSLIRKKELLMQLSIFFK